MHTEVFATANFTVPIICRIGIVCYFVMYYLLFLPLIAFRITLITSVGNHQFDLKSPLSRVLDCTCLPLRPSPPLDVAAMHSRVTTLVTNALHNERVRERERERQVQCERSTWPLSSLLNEYCTRSLCAVRTRIQCRVQIATRDTPGETQNGSKIYQRHSCFTRHSTLHRLINYNRYCSHRRSVIEANEAVAYPVFGHAVSELSG